MPNPCGIYNEQSGTESSFSMNTSVPHCQYHSTNVAYSFIHPSLMLHNVSNSRNYEITLITNTAVCQLSLILLFTCYAHFFQLSATASFARKTEFIWHNRTIQHSLFLLTEL